MSVPYLTRFLGCKWDDERREWSTSHTASHGNHHQPSALQSFDKGIQMLRLRLSGVSMGKWKSAVVSTSTHSIHIRNERFMCLCAVLSDVRTFYYYYFCLIQAFVIFCLAYSISEFTVRCSNFSFTCNKPTHKRTRIRTSTNTQPATSVHPSSIHLQRSRAHFRVAFEIKRDGNNSGMVKGCIVELWWFTVLIMLLGVFIRWHRRQLQRRRWRRIPLTTRAWNETARVWVPKHYHRYIIWNEVKDMFMGFRFARSTTSSTNTDRESMASIMHV